VFIGPLRYLKTSGPACLTVVGFGLEGCARVKPRATTRPPTNTGHCLGQGAACIDSGGPFPVRTRWNALVCGQKRSSTNNARSGQGGPDRGSGETANRQMSDENPFETGEIAVEEACALRARRVSSARLSAACSGVQAMPGEDDPHRKIGG